eukprot:TRINITY_DN1298_c0_g2_i3.p2 TRINITY_DN1298_c0_g2~~TRINITY_DN1298_c0_g2_i3.p2  ORF type:complete len:850 (-),score=195.94 TRINITY_DN1298_c0_g2_i3:4428-6977(-)
MKFGETLLSVTVPEWKGRYIDYKQLKKQIKRIRMGVLSQAQQIVDQKEKEKVEDEKREKEGKEEIVRKSIHLGRLETEEVFFQKVEENLAKVENFYELKQQEMTKTFYGLILQAIRLHLIDEYVPQKGALKTRLERELSRLEVPVKISYDDQVEDGGQSRQDMGLLSMVRVKGNTVTPPSTPNGSSIFRSLPSDLLRKTKRLQLTLSNSFLRSKDGKESELTVKEGESSEKLVDDENSSGNDSQDSAEDNDQKSGITGSPFGSSLKSRNGKPFTISEHPIEDKESEKGDSPKEFDLTDSYEPRQSIYKSSLTRRNEKIPSTINKGNIEAFANSIQVDESILTGKVSGSPKKLKHAFVEFYRGLILLKSYCSVNQQALGKILKKHQKNVGHSGLFEDPRKKAMQMNFWNHKKLEGLMTETENLYAQVFTKGHRTQAMKKLRVTDQGKDKGRSSFVTGIALGISLMLIACMFYVGLTHPGKHNYPEFDSVIIVYRMIGISILLIWGWAIDMFVWTRYRVNYPFIFEFKARDHVSYYHVLQVASISTALWLFSLFLYLIASAKIEGFEWMGKIPFQFWPLSLLGLFAICFIGFQIRSHFWLLRTLARLFSAPWIPVVFRDFFMGDQLVSIVIVLQDLEYTICYFSYDAWVGGGRCMSANSFVKPIIVLIPAGLRFLQCLRRYKDTKDFNQVINAGKYSTTFFVATFSALKGNFSNATWLVLWILSYVISACYALTWDFKKDWSLELSRSKFPRENRLYPVKFYYHAVVTNTILRFAWAFTTSSSTSYLMDANIFYAIIAALEVIRRTQWNLLRLENEQLNNIGKFRAVDVHVPLPDSVMANFSAAPPKDEES